MREEREAKIESFDFTLDEYQVFKYLVELIIRSGSYKRTLFFSDYEME